MARFFFYGEVRSNEETDQMRPEGQVSSGRGGGGGGWELRLSETELRGKFAIGRAHFERVIVSQLGGP